MSLFGISSPADGHLQELMAHERNHNNNKNSNRKKITEENSRFRLVHTDSVRLTTAFGSDHPVVSRSGRKSNLIYTCMYI